MLVVENIEFQLLSDSKEEEEEEALYIRSSMDEAEEYLGGIWRDLETKGVRDETCTKHMCVSVWLRRRSFRIRGVKRGACTWPPNSNVANLVIYVLSLKNQHYGT